MQKNSPEGGSLSTRRRKQKKRIRHATILALALSLVLGAYPGWLVWTDNFHEVVAGEFFRSGQLDRDELTVAIHRYHLRAVLNLRGSNVGKTWYDEEVALCRDTGIQHFDLKLSARKELTAKQIRDLEDLLLRLPRPLLVHCNGGGDRTSFASALYEILVRHKAPEEASLQLSWNYGHFPYLWWSASSAMDRSFARVVAENARSTNHVGTLIGVRRDNSKPHEGD
jgi:hypothetical protein